MLECGPRHTRRQPLRPRRGGLPRHDARVLDRGPHLRAQVSGDRAGQVGGVAPHHHPVDDRAAGGRVGAEHRVEVDRGRVVVADGHRLVDPVGDRSAQWGRHGALALPLRPGEAVERVGPLHLPAVGAHDAADHHRLGAGPVDLAHRLPRRLELTLVEVPAGPAVLVDDLALPAVGRAASQVGEDHHVGVHRRQGLVVEVLPRVEAATLAALGRLDVEEPVLPGTAVDHAHGEPEAAFLGELDQPGRQHPGVAVADHDHVRTVAVDHGAVVGRRRRAEGDARSAVVADLAEVEVARDLPRELADDRLVLGHRRLGRDRAAGGGRHHRGLALAGEDRADHDQGCADAHRQPGRHRGPGEGVEHPAAPDRRLEHLVGHRRERDRPHQRHHGQQCGPYVEDPPQHQQHRVVPEVDAVRDLAQVGHPRQREAARHERARRGVRADDQRDGEQRGEQVAVRDRHVDQLAAEQDVPTQAGDGQHPPGPSPVDAALRTGGGELAQGDREDRAGQQLEEPGVGGEVGAGGVDLGPVELRGDRQRGQDGQPAEQHPRPAGGELPPRQQEQREDDVVLLLDRERPEVHEGRVPDVAGEVVRTVGDELPVGEVDERRLRVAHQPEPLGLRGDQHEHDGRHDDRDHRGGQQPAYASGVVAPQPELARRVHLAEHHVGDEEAGQDEEEVQHDEAAGRPGHAGVEEDDDDDRERAQAVELGAVPPGAGGGGGHGRGHSGAHDPLDATDAQPSAPWGKAPSWRPPVWPMSPAGPASSGAPSDLSVLSQPPPPPWRHERHTSSPAVPAGARPVRSRGRDRRPRSHHDRPAAPASSGPGRRPCSPPPWWPVGPPASAARRRTTRCRRTVPPPSTRPAPRPPRSSTPATSRRPTARSSRWPRRCCPRWSGSSSQGPEGEGSGSGIILSSDGQILTNAHVVEGAGEGAEMTVSFDDGTHAPATVIGSRHR